MKKCALCGNEFSETLVRPDGLPTGLTVLLKTGRLVDICTECLIRTGETGDKEALERLVEDED